MFSESILLVDSHFSVWILSSVKLSYSSILCHDTRRVVNFTAEKFTGIQVLVKGVPQDVVLTLFQVLMHGAFFPPDIRLQH